jgi:aminopeptidase N
MTLKNATLMLFYYLLCDFFYRFANKTNLWDSMISTATGVFTTQEGYDLVSQLYVQRQGEFGSAEHIIEKSLKNIKEETKWSNENLPIIETWLNNYLNYSKNIENTKFVEKK